MAKVFILTPDERNFLENAGDRMPLGALYVAAYLKKHGHEVSVYDLNHDKAEKLLWDVREQKPDFAGFSIISSPSFNYMHKLMALTKAVSPGTRIIGGGYHALARPKDFVFADHVVRGNGEKPMLDIVEGRQPSSETSLIDFNENPIPARELVNTCNYNMVQGGKRTATLISSRGCPFECVFCGNYERAVRFRDPENIREEIRQLIGMGFEALYFFDDAFTLKKDHAISVASVIKEFGLPYRITTRADLIQDEELVKHIADTGCRIVSLGIESGNDQVLENIKKHMTTRDNEAAVELLNKYGIKTKGFFIFGLPGEGEKEARETIEFAKRLKSKGLVTADFYAMTPFPGSPIYDTPGEFGVKILSHNWDEYLEAGKGEITPVLETDRLTKEQIIQFINTARREFRDA